MFRDRREAGRALAKALQRYSNEPDVIVLALPRGGVPVAYEVASALKRPLDVFLVRKLGAPGHPELAMGAIAMGGIQVINEDVVRHLRIPERDIAEAAARELQELERRDRAYRGGRPVPDVTGRTAILIDDGLATGSSMRAAVRALRQRQPARIIIAVPVAARSTCEALRPEVDDVICLMAPESFSAVGEWYQDFSQTTDDEVTTLLQQAPTNPPEP